MSTSGIAPSSFAQPAYASQYGAAQTPSPLAVAGGDSANYGGGNSTPSTYEGADSNLAPIAKKNNNALLWAAGAVGVTALTGGLLIWAHKHFNKDKAPAGNAPGGETGGGNPSEAPHTGQTALLAQHVKNDTAEVKRLEKALDDAKEDLGKAAASRSAATGPAQTAADATLTRASDRLDATKAALSTAKKTLLTSKSKALAAKHFLAVKNAEIERDEKHNILHGRAARDGRDAEPGLLVEATQAAQLVTDSNPTEAGHADLVSNAEKKQDEVRVARAALQVAENRVNEVKLKTNPDTHAQRETAAIRDLDKRQAAQRSAERKLGDEQRNAPSGEKTAGITQAENALKVAKEAVENAQSVRDVAQSEREQLEVANRHLHNNTDRPADSEENHVHALYASDAEREVAANTSDLATKQHTNDMADAAVQDAEEQVRKVDPERTADTHSKAKDHHTAVKLELERAKVKLEHSSAIHKQISQGHVIFK